jgi:NAD(P)-dependent dehydrogenase (short-subunit alcohol dehydrogenase family)
MNVVITGAGKGIGFNLVKEFIANSMNIEYVFALSRNIEELNNLLYNQIKLVPIKCDITDPIQIDLALNIINGKCAKIDYLINNAGFLVNKPFTEITNKDINLIFNTNYTAPFRLIQKLYPLLFSSKEAHIVNISSMGGFQGSSKFSGLSAYSSSKAALNCLTECLAQELSATSIKINALCIGAVQTEMLSQAFPTFKASISAEEMAQFIYQFTIQSHHFMNGKVIPVALSTP